MSTFSTIALVSICLLLVLNVYPINAAKDDCKPGFYYEGSIGDCRHCLLACGRPGKICPRECKVDCLWGKWKKQGPCSQTCNTGVQLFRRESEVMKRFGGADCQGNSTKFEPCFNDRCQRIKKPGEHEIVAGVAEAIQDSKGKVAGVAEAIQDSKNPTANAWGKPLGGLFGSLGLAGVILGIYFGIHKQLQRRAQQQQEGDQGQGDAELQNMLPQKQRKAKPVQEEQGPTDLLPKAMDQIVE